MKKSVLVALAFAGFALSTTGASAQPATQTISLSAFVNSLCTLNGSATGVANNTGVVATSGTASAGGAVTLSGGNSYTLACSTPNTVTITSPNDGLRANTFTGGTNYINYTVNVDQGLAGAALSTSLTTVSGATANRTVTAGPTASAFSSGTVTIGVTSAAATGLSPGTFSDTLTVTFQPQ